MFPYLSWQTLRTHYPRGIKTFSSLVHRRNDVRLRTNVTSIISAFESNLGISIEIGRARERLNGFLVLAKYAFAQNIPELLYLLDLPDQSWPTTLIPLVVFARVFGAGAVALLVVGDAAKLWFVSPFTRCGSCPCTCWTNLLRRFVQSLRNATDRPTVPRLVPSGNATSQFQRCDINKADSQCGENERCFQNSENEEAHCRCVRGFEAKEDQCVQITTFRNVIIDQSTVQVHSGGSSVAAGLLIPTFLVVTSVLLYFVARRYKWLQRVRQLRSNRYGNVLVTRDDDDDDDDPPIA